MKSRHISDHRAILVIGGTGMLRPAVTSLVNRGMTVLVVARRPHRGAPQKPSMGLHIPVEADWNDPKTLAQRVQAVLEDRLTPRPMVQGAIIWIHSPYRQAVLDQLEHVLSPEARLLQLWGSAAQDPRQVMAAEDHTVRSWDTRHLFLGYQRDDGVSRWLTSLEVSQATLHAWDDESKGNHRFIAGELDPWSHRP